MKSNTTMDLEERTRRGRLWRRHVVRGEPLDELLPELSDELGVDEDVLEKDIETIDEWLPQLDLLRKRAGVSLLGELRLNRQALNRLADQARDKGDLTGERKIRQEINRSINIERSLHEDSLRTEMSDENIFLDKMTR
jgi:hypothetical protein